MESNLYFMECLDENCRFRFPLDLDAFEGKVCPMCGSELRAATKRTPQWQPGQLKNNLPEFFLLLDNIRSAHNVGSILRTCEGADIRKVFLGGLTPTPSNNRSISKAALGAEERVDWAWTANSLQTVRELKAEGFKALALECLPDASNLFEINPGLLTGEKWLIILGSEPAGIDPGLVELADISVFIPMGGEKSSLNVSVAFGIAVYGLRFIFNR